MAPRKPVKREKSGSAKFSISLPADLVTFIDELDPAWGDRAKVIQTALRFYRDGRLFTLDQCVDALKKALEQKMIEGLTISMPSNNGRREIDLAHLGELTESVRQTMIDEQLGPAIKDGPSPEQASEAAMLKFALQQLEAARLSDRSDRDPVASAPDVPKDRKD